MSAPFVCLFVCLFVGGGGGRSQQYLWSYQDEYRLRKCDVWKLYSGARLEDWAIPSHYSDTEHTNPCSILFLLSARLGSGKYKLCKSLV